MEPLDEQDLPAKPSHEDEHKDQILKTVDQWHRLRWIAVAVLGTALFIIVGIGIYLLISNRSELHHDEVRLIASCSVARDIGTAPIAVNPTTGKPSELGVKIITDFRGAFLKQGCPGTLPPPTPSLVRWANYYSIPIDDGGTPRSSSLAHSN